MVEVPVNPTGQIAFETSQNLFFRFALCLSFHDVDPGFLIVAHFTDRNHMQGAVERAIAAAIQPVSDGVS